MTIHKKKQPEARPPFPLYTKYPSKFEQVAYQTYNSLDNKLWPIRPAYFVGATAAFAAYHYRNPENAVLSVLPKTATQIVEIAKIGMVSLCSAYVPSLVIRQFLKYFYFSYKGFLFDNPKRPSLKTKLWSMVRFLLSFSPPLLKSCENLLPSQPVPPLQQTIITYLESIKQIATKDEYDLVVEQAHTFLKEEGRKLQMYCTIYSLFTSNYVSEFWRKYAYLYGRDSLMINSSVAHVDLFVDKPATRAYRAAHVLKIESLSHLAIHRQNYKPLGDGLLCACHYDNMYAVNRVPGQQIDQLKDYGISRHIAVLVKGNIYKVEYCDDNGTLYTIEQLAKIFDELITRAEANPNETVMAHVAALTCDRRDQWSENRMRFFLKNTQNKKSLEVIESALYFFIMEDEENHDYDPANPSMLNGFMKSMLTGNGSNRWADKSLNYIMNKNTRCGGTTEHSIADGSEFDHIMENFVYMDTQILKYPPLEEQKKLISVDAQSAKKEGLKLAEKLELELVDEEMSSEIIRCQNTQIEAGNDVDLVATIFRDWGKGRIKKCGCSPDAFVQMAIQLANYRDQGKFVLTYEPASVRFYRNSRTETLRTVGDESCAFVLAMENKEFTNAERIKLLKIACEKHVAKNKECMVGKGVDRHLFVLYILSQGTGISSPFLDYYINQKWLLSTSHVPNVTQQVDEDAEVDSSWLGACFAAVAKNGYGICYRFAGNHSICAHISSFHSAPNTDSQRFQKLLVEALNDISAMFE